MGKKYIKETASLISSIKLKVLEFLSYRKASRYINENFDDNKFKNVVDDNINKLRDEDILVLSKKLKSLKARMSKKEFIINALALAFLAIRKIKGITLYDEQLLGAIIMYGYKIDNNVFAEIKTGEGKTYIALLTAYLNSFDKQVHIMSSNAMLATRDFKENKSIYNLLGIDVGLIVDSFVSSDELKRKQKKEAYSKRVVYGDSRLVFDYLEDQLVDKDEILQNKHEVLIVDEVDNLLIDQGKTPFVLSGGNNNSSLGYDNELIKKKLILLEIFISNIIKSEELIRKYIEKDYSKLTLEGLDALEKFIKEQEYFIEDLNDLETYIPFVKDVIYINFILNSGKQKIKVDNISKDNVEFSLLSESTGRVLEGQQYSDNFFTLAVKIHHKYLDLLKQHNGSKDIASELLKLDAKESSDILREINCQNFLKTYEKVSGMSGTIISSKKFFEEAYNATVVVIPTHNSLKRKDNPIEIFKDSDSKYMRMLEIIDKELVKSPILIKTDSIEQVDIIKKLLEKKYKSQGITINTLTAENIIEEEKIIKNAGKLGQITIATDVAGRGIDIKIDNQLEEYGLCVINTSLDLKRVESQFVGRSGRKGQNGISYSLISFDEYIIQKYRDYFDDYYYKDYNRLLKMIKNSVNEEEKAKVQGEKEKLLMKFIKKIQELEEMHNLELIKTNNEIYSLLNKFQSQYDLIKEKLKQDLMLISDSDTLYNNILSYVESRWRRCYQTLSNIQRQPQIIREDSNSYKSRLNLECKQIFESFIDEVAILFNIINSDLDEKIKNCLLFCMDQNHEININDIKGILVNYENNLKFIIKKSTNKDDLLKNILNLVKSYRKKEILDKSKIAKEEIIDELFINFEEYINFENDQSLYNNFFTYLQNNLKNIEFLDDFINEFQLSNYDYETYMEELNIKYLESIKFFALEFEDLIDILRNYTSIEVNYLLELSINNNILIQDLKFMLIENKEYIEKVIKNIQVGESRDKEILSLIKK